MQRVFQAIKFRFNYRFNYRLISRLNVFVVCQFVLFFFLYLFKNNRFHLVHRTETERKRYVARIQKKEMSKCANISCMPVKYSLNL